MLLAKSAREPNRREKDYCRGQGLFFVVPARIDRLTHHRADHYIHFVVGRLAQLVQSTALTRQGSLVRVQ